MFYKTLYKQVVREAESYLNKRESFFELRDGLRLLYVSREATDWITNCSMAYWLTLDEKYAECAYRELESVCKFDSWNPYHFLDVGLMSLGVALGYDLLYNWMNAKQRAMVREALIKNAIEPVLEDIAAKGHRTYYWFKKGNVCNWRCVVGGGIGCAILAIIDELQGKDLQLSQFVLQNMLEGLDCVKECSQKGFLKNEIMLRFAALPQ